MSSTARVGTSRALYKHLLREVGKLPTEARPHYRHHVRQGFNQHRDETDPERVQQIIAQAMKDAVWLVNKVSFMVTTSCTEIRNIEARYYYKAIKSANGNVPFFVWCVVLLFVYLFM